jgi:hypothetical protein
MPWATSTRNPSTPRSSQKRRTDSNSSPTSGFSQSKSGWDLSNRCRYHCPSGTRVHCRAAEEGLPVVRRRVADPVAEHVARPLPAAGRGDQRLLEPHVLVGGVVRDEVDDDLETQLVRVLEHGVEGR